MNDGLFLLDKPSGPSSSKALTQLRKFFNLKKAGHTGTLDPLASGVLPCLFGEATKFSHSLLEADKRYVVEAKLGTCTDTGDALGAVIASSSIPTLNEALLETALRRFKGAQEQTAPQYSALKYQGRPLYHYARRGIEVPAKIRLIEIFSLRLLQWGEDHLTLEVHCSKGTYIRRLVEEIGQQLGCAAHVSALRRTACGSWRQAHALSTLAAQPGAGSATQLAAYAVGLDTILSSLPRLLVDQAEATWLGHGRALAREGVVGTVVCYLAQPLQLLGLARGEEGWIRPVRWLAASR